MKLFPMIQKILIILATLSLSSAPTPAFDPFYLYGFDVPIQPTMIAQNTEASANPPDSVIRATAETIRPPHKKDPNDLGIVHTGKSGFIADVESAGVLYADHPHDVYPIASLTKLMTAIVVMESPTKLNGEITFQADDFDVQSRSFFRIGDKVARKDVMRAMLIGSVNEAAQAFSRSSGMREEDFIVHMNQKARELQLTSFVFADPTGLDAGNRGSAADVAALLTIAMRYPEIREAMNSANLTVTTTAQRSYQIEPTNLLLYSYLNKDPYQIVGSKTGSLPAAGFNLAQVTRNAYGHEVVVVLLGSDNHFSRYQDVKAMTSWAFDAYQW